MKVVDKLSSATTLMRNLKLNKDIQDDVRDFLIHTSSSLENQKELEIFLDSLVPSIRNKVTHHIFLDSFNKNDIFKAN